MRHAYLDLLRKQGIRKKFVRIENILFAIALHVLAYFLIIAGFFLIIVAVLALWSNAHADTITTRNIKVITHVYDTGGLDYVDVWLQCKDQEWEAAEHLMLNGATEAHLTTLFTALTDTEVRARMLGCDLGKHCVEAVSDWYTIDTQDPGCFVEIEGE